MGTIPIKPSSRWSAWATNAIAPNACYDAVRSFGVLAMIGMLRQRGVPAWDGLWAEDGQVFLHDAMVVLPPPWASTTEWTVLLDRSRC